MINIKIKANTVVKNLKTLTFFVEEHEINIPDNDTELLKEIETNNISCALEIQKLLLQHWFYSKPPEIKTQKKKNFIKNCHKRLGIK